MWILLVILQTPTHVAVVTQEFNTRHTCEVAKAWIGKSNLVGTVPVADRPTSPLRAECLPK